MEIDPRPKKNFLFQHKPWIFLSPDKTLIFSSYSHLFLIAEIASSCVPQLTQLALILAHPHPHEVSQPQALHVTSRPPIHPAFIINN